MYIIILLLLVELYPRSDSYTVCIASGRRACETGNALNMAV